MTSQTSAPVFSAFQMSHPPEPSLRLSIHPLLRYTHHVSTGSPCSIIGHDIRDFPAQALLLPEAYGQFYPGPIKPRQLTPGELNQQATIPPTAQLSIVCGRFDPFPWRVDVFNRNGVTIFDVLQGIHDCVHTRMRRREWGTLARDQRNRMSATFHERCAHAMDQWAETEEGVKRMDYLGISNRFSGISLRKGTTCVLTVDRNKRF